MVFGTRTRLDTVKDSAANRAPPDETPSGGGRGGRPHALTLMAVVAVVAGLHFGQAVLIPIALAALLSFLLTPPVRALERVGVPRVPAVAAVVISAALLVAAVGWIVGSQAAGMLGSLPDYRQNIVAKVRDLRDSFSGFFSSASNTVADIQKEIEAATTQPATTTAAAQPAGDYPEDGRDEAAALVEDAEVAPDALDDAASAPPPPVEEAPVKVQVVGQDYELLEVAQWIIGPVIHPLSTLFLSIVLLAFILVQREDVRDRIIRLGGHARINVTTDALTDAGMRVTRYLIVQVLVNSFAGLSIGLGLLAIGLPGALLWGLLAGLLRFVPFVGTWISALLPIGLSIAVFDGWSRPLMVVGVFLLIDVLCVNILEPWLYGARTGASPLAILVSAIFWTWLWGGIGLLLATPMTVCLVVLGKYVPDLQVLYILLTDEPVLPRSARLFQRLLAMDRMEVRALVRRSIEQQGAELTFDSVIVPALRLVSGHGREGPYDQRRHDFIHGTLAELIAEAGPSVEKERPPSRLTAHDKRDRETGVAEAARATSRGHESKPAPSTGSVASTDTDAAAILCVAARDDLDDLAAAMLGSLLKTDGLNVRVLASDVLTSELVETIRENQPRAVCVIGLTSALERMELLCRRLEPHNVSTSLLLCLPADAAAARRATRRLAPGGNVEVAASLAAARKAVVRLSQLAPAAT